MEHKRSKKMEKILQKIRKDIFIDAEEYRELFLDEEKDLAKRQVDEIYIAIEQVLMFYGTPAYYYSIGEPVDECACLEYRDHEWIVYEMSCGNKINKTSFSSAYEAGCKLFDIVAINNDILILMEERLKIILSYISRVNEYRASRLNTNITFYNDSSLKDSKGKPSLISPIITQSFIENVSKDDLN